jgi:hypothetical protein
VTLNAWHTVVLSRTGRSGSLQVDDDPLEEGWSPGVFTQLTLGLDLFVGGHRNFDETARSAGARKSFSGCIQKVRSGVSNLILCVFRLKYNSNICRRVILIALAQISIYYNCFGSKIYLSHINITSEGQQLA